MPGAASATEVADVLDLANMRNRQWYIQSTCATTGEGLVEGLEWLAESIKAKR